MTERYDAVVIGAGHNGLVAAARLAKAGKRTVVLEARDFIGGMLGGDAPITVSPYRLRPEIERALNLSKFGLRYAGPQKTVALGAGEPVIIDGARVRGVSDKLSARYSALHARLARFAGALAPMLLRPPPRLRDGNSGDTYGLARLGLAIRGLGKEDMRELLRIILSNVWDLVQDEIEDGPLGGAVAMEATLGSALAPRSPGTVLSLLYRMAAISGDTAGVRAVPEGGGEALVSALEGAATAAGVKIITNAPVEKLLVSDDDAIEGVLLASGEHIQAPVVLSNASPRTTLLGLLGKNHLDAEAVRRLRNMATRGMAARIDFELSESLPGAVSEPRSRLVVAPSMMYIERAFNAAKYGDLAPQPAIEGVMVERKGQPQFSTTVQYAPYGVNGGWTSEAKTKLAEYAASAIDDVMPGFSSRVTGSHVMTPDEIETGFGASGGHWHHGELRIDQMLMLRPSHGLSQYEMPVHGLFLCGAGAHPGGDISGAPGWNAAGQALKNGSGA